MLLVLDVGNSNIKTGLFDGDTLLSSWRMASDRNRAGDEYGITMLRFFDYIGETPEKIDGVIIASVVPGLNYTLERMIRHFFGLAPLLVDHTINLGISIDYDPPHVLGADRIANAVAAYEEYGGPCITVDFGTATTFGAIDASGTFRGGAIAPGIRTSVDALVSSAAQLHRIDFERPASALAKNTVEGLQSGVIFGFSGMADNIIRNFKQEMGEATVIATGGLSNVIAAESTEIDKADRLLTLKGLRLIYEKNV